MEGNRRRLETKCYLAKARFCSETKTCPLKNPLDGGVTAPVASNPPARPNRRGDPGSPDSTGAGVSASDGDLGAPIRAAPAGPTPLPMHHAVSNAGQARRLERGDARAGTHSRSGGGGVKGAITSHADPALPCIHGKRHTLVWDLLWDRHQQRTTRAAMRLRGAGYRRGSTSGALHVRGRPLRRDPQGGGGSFGALASLGRPPSHNRKIFLRQKNEIYQMGRKFAADFRHTNFFLASDPAPGGGGGGVCHTRQWPGQRPNRSLPGVHRGRGKLPRSLRCRGEGADNVSRIALTIAGVRQESVRRESRGTAAATTSRLAVAGRGE